MKKLNLLTILMVAIIFSFGSNKPTKQIDNDSTRHSYNKSDEQIMKKTISHIMDIDNNLYNTVTIGTQEWMSENLNVEHYRNDDAIPHIKDAKYWETLTTGAWCFYYNNSENEEKYGRLYNWFAVNDSRRMLLKVGTY